MEFFHTSTDLTLDRVLFRPRVPQYRLRDEDNKIKRICVCKSIEESVNAFPYKKYFVNYSLRRNKTNYLAVYKFETNDYLDSIDIVDKVGDALITGECWLTKSFMVKPIIIKVQKMELEHCNKYTNEYYGDVKNFEYEKDIEDHDREENFIFISKESFNKAIKIINQSDMKFDLIEDTHVQLEHVYGLATTKNYRWIQINVHIPAGVNIAPIWIIDSEQNEFAKRKKILLKKGNVFKSDEEWDQYFCELTEGDILHG